MGNKTNDINKQLFYVNQRYFQIFDAMVDSEIFPTISASAFKIYTVIKRYASFKDGISRIAIPHIIQISGILDDKTITKAINELEEKSLIKVKKSRGRRNNYLIYELFEATPQSKLDSEYPTADISVPYHRFKIIDAVNNIPNQIERSFNGNIIENISINFNYNDHRSIHIDKTDDDSIPADYKIWDAMKKKKGLV